VDGRDRVDHEFAQPFPRGALRKRGPVC
jgi:hypothetical protein